MNRDTVLALVVFAVGYLCGAGTLRLIRGGDAGPSAAAAREMSHSISQQAKLQQEMAALVKQINSSLFTPVRTEDREILDPMLSDMIADLQTIRSQLELYRVEHGMYPNGQTSDKWQIMLTRKTARDGSRGSDYGPYLCTFPVNPFNKSSRVLIDPTGQTQPGTRKTTGPEACGWYFDTTTGKFAPNDSAEHGEL